MVLTRKKELNLLKVIVVAIVLLLTVYIVTAHTVFKRSNGGEAKIRAPLLIQIPKLRIV